MPKSLRLADVRIEPWHRNLAAVWLAQALSAIAFSFILPFIPLYVQFLGVKGTTEAANWAGIIGAAAAVSMAFTQPIWGNMADRWGRKPMLVRSTIGGSIIIALMGLAASPEHLVILRFIQGAVTGVVAAANALVATSTPKARLGFALGMMQVAMFTGMSIGPLVGGLIADTLGYRAAFFAAGLFLLLGGVVVVAFVREEFTPPTMAARGLGILAQSRTLLAIATFPILVSVIFMIQIGGMIVSPVLSLFIAELSGAGNAATVAGTVMAATGVVSAVSAVVVGRISDRVGHTRIMLICLLGAALFYFPQAFVSDLWQLLALRMVLGVFLGGLMPTANALVANLVPAERRGAAYGLTATANAVAFGVGPLSGAGIASLWGMRAVFVAASILFALNWCWARFSIGKQRSPSFKLKQRVNGA